MFLLPRTKYLRIHSRANQTILKQLKLTNLLYYSTFLIIALKQELTASASDGSYQTLMYGCCRASSTEILLDASITSIFDNKSLA